MKNEPTKKLKATIHIWSAIGHTPLTGRGGAYCDELVKFEDEFDDLAHIRAATRELLLTTPHAEKAHYYAPDAPNNFRTDWMLKSSVLRS